MRNSLLLIFIFFFSCQLRTGQGKLVKTLTGNWLVVAADHRLTNRDQYIIYGDIQDSVVEAKCLKLIRISSDGSFEQLDYPGVKGLWDVSSNNKILFKKGGRGFEDFRTDFIRYKDNELIIGESLEAGGEKIWIEWYLKKIDDPFLFGKKENAWRSAPKRRESPQEIKERLALMLHYYSRYYKLVSKEASYFIGKRIMMPFRFYQHAMSTIPFDPDSDFVHFFYNREQAVHAYFYLKSTVYDLSNKFPSGENFVDEYASFMEMLAEKIPQAREP